MKHVGIGVALAVSIASASAYGLRVFHERDTGAAPSTEPAVPAAVPEAAPLAFTELFEAGAALRPTAKALGLAGQRVRLVGFMAQMELPPAGAFYLVPRPVRCDEAGSGTGDLPPESVLVISPASAGKAVAFVPGALEVAGTFEIGNRVDADGRVSAFRLRLDLSPPSSNGGSSK